MITTDTKEILEKHIEKCVKKSKDHKRYASNAKFYENTSNNLNTLATAGSLLAITVMTSLGVGSIPIGITSGVSIFLINTIDKIKNYYQFNVLHCVHNNLSDDFKELEYDFVRLLTEYHASVMDNKNLELYISKYLLVCSKSHQQKVSVCCK